MPTSNNFMENYKICCSDSKTRLKVKSLSQDQSLQFNADRLDEEDWTPLTRALKNDRTLHTLVIKSEYFGKKWRCSLVNDVKPSIYKPDVMNELIDSIVICMKESMMLSTLKLQSLPMNACHIDTLSKSLPFCQNLQHLAIVHVQLNDDCVKSLCDSIKTHTGIQTINLSDCNLTSSGVGCLADLIRAQRLVRYSETWKQSLRYREPNPDLLPGLRRITINNNQGIMDEGFRIIQHELVDDLWIKAVDVQNCGLTNISADLALDLINTNLTILVLDLRRNDSINCDTIKTIKKLLNGRNIDCDRHTIGHNHDPVYDWLDGKSTTSNKSYNTCRKPISEFSLNTRLNVSKTNLLNDERNKIHNEINDAQDFCFNEEKLLGMKSRVTVKEQLSEKLVKEWNRRKTIEKERDKLKDMLNNFKMVINYTKETPTPLSSSLQSSKSLNLKYNNHKKNHGKINKAKSFPGSSDDIPRLTKKSIKRNKKVTKNKLSSKKLNTNNDYLVNDDNNKKSSFKSLSNSNEEVRKSREKQQRYQIKQNQNEIQNIQENLDKINLNYLQLATIKKEIHKNNENKEQNENNEIRNEDGKGVQKDFRDLSPTTRSRWILNQLMNGKKNQTQNNLFNKYNEQTDVNEIKKTDPKDKIEIDLDNKWDLIDS